MAKEFDDNSVKVIIAKAEAYYHMGQFERALGEPQKGSARAFVLAVAMVQHIFIEQKYSDEIGVRCDGTRPRCLWEVPKRFDVSQRLSQWICIVKYYMKLG